MRTDIRPGRQRKHHHRHRSRDGARTASWVSMPLPLFCAGSHRHFIRYGRGGPGGDSVFVGCQPDSDARVGAPPLRTHVAARFESSANPWLEAERPEGDDKQVENVSPNRCSARARALRALRRGSAGSRHGGAFACMAASSCLRA
jgi:hypothetical protein